MEGLGEGVLWTLLHPERWEPAAAGLTVATVALMLGSRRIHPAVPIRLRNRSASVKQDMKRCCPLSTLFIS